MPACSLCDFFECNNICKAQNNKYGLYKNRAIETTSMGVEYWRWAQRVNKLIDSGTGPKESSIQATKEIYKKGIK